LPGVKSEGVGEVAIAIDCSGSIHARQLGLFEDARTPLLDTYQDEAEGKVPETPPV
jgi:hypothetical protein